jgi:hypothetical protein
MTHIIARFNYGPLFPSGLHHDSIIIDEDISSAYPAGVMGSPEEATSAFEACDAECESGFE